MTTDEGGRRECSGHNRRDCDLRRRLTVRTTIHPARFNIWTGATLGTVGMAIVTASENGRTPADSVGWPAPKATDDAGPTT